MAQAGFVLLLLGFLGLLYGVYMRLRAGRVAGAPLVSTGDAASQGERVAGEKGAISVEGNVVCDAPLVSPVTSQACLFYDLKVTAQWKEGDTTKSKEIAREKRAAAFALDDGSGPVAIDAREGGDFEPEQTKSETKALSLLGGITGQKLQFGAYELQIGAMHAGTKYHVEEKILAVEPRLYACGRAVQGKIAAPSWRQLLLTAKSRDAYLADANKGAKVGLAAGGSAFALGLVLAIVGRLAAPAPVSDTTATNAAPPAATTATPAPRPAGTTAHKK